MLGQLWSFRIEDLIPITVRHNEGVAATKGNIDERKFLVRPMKILVPQQTNPFHLYELDGSVLKPEFEGAPARLDLTLPAHL
ncbi:MAG: hypothetical protein V3V49_04275 [Candidatus Krumholzibacteria bacterium]